MPQKEFGESGVNNLSDVINVLGRDYTINLVVEEDYPKLISSNANGLCEAYNHNIYVLTGYEDEQNCVANVLEYKHKVLRHELFHAIFYECGMGKYAEDEDLVDLLARLYPKIERIMNEAKKIDLGKNNI